MQRAHDLAIPSVYDCFRLRNPSILAIGKNRSARRKQEPDVTQSHRAPPCGLAYFESPDVTEGISPFAWLISAGAKEKCDDSLTC